MSSSRDATGGPAQTVAMARYRVLAPHLNQGMSLAAAARAAEVPYRTAQRWLAAYREGGLPALERSQRADKGRRRTPDDLVAFIEGLALESPRVPVAAIHRRAVGMATQHGWPRPGYGTVYQIVAALARNAPLTAGHPTASDPRIASTQSATPPLSGPSTDSRVPDPEGMSVSRWPLAGRDRELEEARAGWELRHCKGVVVCGAAGVGKTRLAHELQKRVVASEGLRTGLATATVAAAGIPLGAIVHLIPPGADLSDPVHGFAQVAEALAGPDGSRRWAWLLDDAHLLDAASAVLVRQLMDAGIVRLIATLRTGEPLSNATDALQAGESVARIDLAPFKPGQVGAVLQAALGGPVTRRSVHQLAQMSGGNALYLRDLVLSALAQGSLGWDGEIWQLAEDRTLSATPRLAQLIEARLAGVDPRGQAVLALLALCEPVSVADAEAAANDPSVLAGLEAAGLVHARTEGHRTTMSLAHPLYGEVLRETLPALYRRAVLLEQIARVHTHGANRREDAVRIAAWELAATGTTDPDLLVKAASLAGYAHDYAQALSLLDALPEHAHTTATRLMQGEAHYAIGSSAKRSCAVRTPVPSRTCSPSPWPAPPTCSGRPATSRRPST